MLILSRLVGQRIIIAEDVIVTVVAIGNGRVRLGFEAPRDVEIVREELLNKEKPCQVQKPSV